MMTARKKSEDAKIELVIALDVAEIETAKRLVADFGAAADFYKIGLGSIGQKGCFEFIAELKRAHKKVFCDLKFHDIPKTVGRAVESFAKLGIDLLTVHTADRAMMRAAAQNKGDTKIVGVTVLTSLDQQDLKDIGFDPKISLEDLVLKKAELALASGLDGVVASAFEAKLLRAKLGNDFLIVTPGIRIEEDKKDDQKRAADVKTAIKNGSSHLVVGRPIIESTDPIAILTKIKQLMA